MSWRTSSYFSSIDKVIPPMTNARALVPGAELQLGNPLQQVALALERRVDTRAMAVLAPLLQLIDLLLHRRVLARQPRASNLMYARVERQRRSEEHTSELQSQSNL